MAEAKSTETVESISIKTDLGVEVPCPVCAGPVQVGVLAAVLKFEGRRLPKVILSPHVVGEHACPSIT